MAAAIHHRSRAHVLLRWSRRRGDARRKRCLDNGRVGSRRCRRRHRTWRQTSCSSRRSCDTCWSRDRRPSPSFPAPSAGNRGRPIPEKNGRRDEARWRMEIPLHFRSVARLAPSRRFEACVVVSQSRMMMMMMASTSMMIMMRRRRRRRKKTMMFTEIKVIGR